MTCGRAVTHAQCKAPSCLEAQSVRASCSRTSCATLLRSVSCLAPRLRRQPVAAPGDYSRHEPRIERGLVSRALGAISVRVWEGPRLQLLTRAILRQIVSRRFAPRFPFVSFTIWANKRWNNLVLADERILSRLSCVSVLRARLTGLLKREDFKRLKRNTTRFIFIVDSGLLARKTEGHRRGKWSNN